ncbi:MAG: D-alanine--poly(phosphoribitol) ligase subunit DltA [Bacillaceae bacterium]
MLILTEMKKWSEVTPEQLAFTSRLGNITYKALWEKSDLIANFLIKKGIKKEAVIIYGHMEPDMLVAFLSCSKSGNAYIPIDTSFPLDRLEKIIVNSQTRLVITMEPILLPQTEGVEIVCIKELYEEVPKQIVEVEASTYVKGHDNYYIIYTSGSTGEPKGVQISHDNLVSFVSWMRKEMVENEGQIFLNQAPFSFDLSVMDIYPCLVSGGTLVGVDKGLLTNPKELFPYLENSSLQVWTSTPSFMEMCLSNREFNGDNLPHLHTFLFCGEILTNNCAGQLLERFPNAAIYNTYGPTEATVAFTSIQITEEILHAHHTLPIGYPKDDGQVEIVDANGVPVVEGEKGEFVLIGPSVSKGYLFNEERTEKAFMKINEMQAYRTGDAGYRKNGLLFYGGRMDFQIKLNGYRIELEDIENNLCSTSLIRSAIVIPIEKDGKYEYLTAYVVVKEHEFDKEFRLTSAIKKELGLRIPAYMIPRKFVYVDALPMTQNGKVDRKRMIAEVVTV